MPRRESTPLRAAIIGLGNIANRYQDDPKRRGIVTHAAAYSQNQECQLVAGCDPDNNQRKHFEKNWKNVSLYHSTSELLVAEDIDIVSICTDDQSHQEVLATCLEAPISGYFCEKPLANSLASARQLADQFANKQPHSTLALNFSRRWDPMHQAFQQDIRAGHWGTIQTIDAYYTGSLHTTGCHVIDSLRMLVGEVNWVASLPGKSENNAVLGFDEGVTAIIQHLDRSQYLIYELDFYFATGRLRIEDSGFRTSCWEVLPSKQFSGYQNLSACHSPYGAGYQNVLSHALSDLVDCIKTDRQPLCSIQNGIRALEIEEAVLESYSNLGQRVDLQEVSL